MAMQIAQVEFGWFIPTTGDGKYIGVEARMTGELPLPLYRRKFKERLASSAGGAGRNR